MYGKCGHLFDAQKLFDEIPVRSVFVWNALIGVYVSGGQLSEAIGLYLEMRGLGVVPDGCTFASVLKACGGCEDVELGSEIHSLAVKCGLNLTTFVGNAFVAMYSKCGRFAHAKKLFEMMGDGRDGVSWNSVISKCEQDGQFFDVLNFLREMSRVGVEMNSYTVVGVFHACAELLLVKLGLDLCFQSAPPLSVTSLLLRLLCTLAGIAFGILLHVYCTCD